MLRLLAHQGLPPGRSLWAEWNFDPLLLFSLGAIAWLFRRGARRYEERRNRWFWSGLVALTLALVSPLDALSGELASAHMVQHVLLVLVAAPLLALSAPVGVLLRGVPFRLRIGLGSLRRVTRRRWLLEHLRRPGVAWLLHAAALWFWHASGPYDAALRNESIHVAEHASFLLTALLFWSALLDHPGRPVVSHGYRVLLVFTMAMQSVLLSVLLTFATQPWYDAYRLSSRGWGLDPLLDQQLAGVIMWVPAGFVYLGAGIALMARWVRRGDLDGPHADSDWAPPGTGIHSPELMSSRTPPR